MKEEPHLDNVRLGGHGGRQTKTDGCSGGLVEPNSPEMEIASNKTTKVGQKFKTTTPKVRTANQKSKFRVM
jgi:hypothetical protein